MTMTLEEAEKIDRPEIVSGGTYPFYVEMFQDGTPAGERMRDYTGQTVTVVRPLRTDECDPDSSRGFIVRAANGFKFTALEEELNGWDYDLGQYVGPSGIWGSPC